MVKDLISSVDRVIGKYRMLERGDSVLVSVSGGPDSVFLLHALKKLATKYRMSLKVFHLDHLTRQGRSAEDASFVEGLCKKEGLPLRLFRVDARAWSSGRGFSFQEGARALRLNLLRDTAKKEGANKIATGHNADDSLETFFLNLLRGSGITGLGAIKPVSGEIIRPLIETYKEDILKYLEDKKIAYCIDHTNLEDVYARNRIRNKLFPLLEEEFNPDFKKNILTLACIARQEDAYMEKLAQKQIEDNARTLMAEGKTILLELDTCCLQGLDLALRRRAVRRAIRMVKGDSRDITARNIEQVLKIACPGGEAKKIQPAENVLAVKEKERLYFLDIDKKEHLPPEYQAFFKDLEFEEQFLPEEGRSRFYKGFNINVEAYIRRDVSGKEYRDASCAEAFMDYDKIRFPVKIRNWRKGDKFFPLGTGGGKKLQDIFTDLKIPRHKRSMVPVFEDREKIIWVGGCRIDERVKVGPDTGRVLYIKIF
ncbi:MAG: tRNA lysidine(34) synthetase TilS [Actinomycetota bacterium]